MIIKRYPTFEGRKTIGEAGVMRGHRDEIKPIAILWVHRGVYSLNGWITNRRWRQSSVQIGVVRRFNLCGLCRKPYLTSNT